VTLPLPSHRDEAWRWTDFAALEAAARSSSAMAPDGVDRFLDLEGPKLLFVDGVLDEARSALGPLSLAQLNDETAHPLGARTSGRAGWTARLGAEAAGTVIQIVHVGTGGDSHLPASLIVADDVPATLVETFVGGGWANRLVRIALGRSARLMRAVRLMQDDGFVSIRDEAELGEGASLATNFLAAGGASTRIDGSAVLAAPGAYAEIGGALLARGRQRHDAAMVVRHAAPEGASRQLWRSVADDMAAASVAARVEVARDAQKTDGEQSLKGLLLSRTATINAKPELEIFADDVKCAHGATVGELDRDALFYFASRGVPEAEAKALLTHAFVADAIERIGQEQVREAFAADADNWLNQRSLVPSEVEGRS
jgi:Fe-S cluster assembly protein SufD